MSVDEPKKPVYEDLPEKVLALAGKQGIDLAQDPELLEILKSANPGKRMPDDVYAIIAEIVIHVYHLKDKWKSS